MLRNIDPDIVIFSDVVEHLNDPIKVLFRIRSLIDQASATVIISTPDRACLDTDPNGPPRNELHVREWTAEEFRRLLSSVGLVVLQSWHLSPRSYGRPLQEARQLLERAKIRKGLVERRHNVVFQVAADHAA